MANSGAGAFALASARRARNAQKQAHEIFRRLIAENGTVPAYGDGLVQALLEEGTLAQLAEQWPVARGLLDQALPICQRLVADHPEVRTYQSRLALAYSQVGRIYQVTKEPEQARTFFGKALATCVPLESDPATASLVPVLVARIHMNLGTLNAMPGLSTLPGQLANVEQARVHYLAALGVLERLDRQFPDVPEYQLLRAETYHLLAVLFRANKRYAEAADQSTQAVSFLERLTREHQDVVEYRFRLANLYHNQGLTFLLQNRLTEARSSYERGATLVEQLVREHAMPDYQRELAALAYDQACLESLAAGAVLGDATLTPADRQTLNDQYCRQSLIYLQTAWVAGFKNRPDALELIKSGDTDFKPLRDRADFKKLLDDLENEPPANPPAGTRG
jgi:tetratricopeptide (TPR) repeat protein